MLPPDPSLEGRQIRIFVSSTFRDMQEDRDELVKRVFPRLRKQCEQRGVAWSEVDLRWGITDEQRAEGQVLPTCLAEIRRCHPFFLGLLGERYGWVPDAMPPGLVDREAWLAEAAGCSVTELEILHGVLNDPAMQGHAYFYLRDPAYSARVDPEPEPADRRRKLADLKERIRRSEHPVREPYPDPRTLGEWVHEDLAALVDRLFPAAEAVDPAGREGATHRAYEASRTRVYVPPAGLFDRLDAQVRGTGPPLVVTGESGGGKSALLANWVHHVRARSSDVPVIAHYVGAGGPAADPLALLRRLVGELRRVARFEAELPEEGPALRGAFADALARAAQSGPCVLVIDGLEQVEDREGAPDLTFLPESLPAAVRLVVSTLPGRPLEAARRRGWPELVVAPLSAPARAELLASALGAHAKALPEAEVRRIAASPAAANPLFLCTLVEELRQHGVHETLGDRLDELLAAPDVPSLLALVLARWEQDFERDRPGLVRDALKLLWASQRGLAESEWLDLLGDPAERLPAAFWSPFYLAAESALLNRSGLIGFGHDYLRRAVEERYLGTASARRATYLELADYFAARGPTRRTAEELPGHLAGAEAWDRLALTLADADFWRTLLALGRHEVNRHWARVEGASEIRLAGVFAPVMADPLRDPLDTWRVASLLAAFGYRTEAIALQEALVGHYRAQGDAESLQASLCNLGISYKARGDHDLALELHQEEEDICRELGDRHALQAALGNQALILAALGDPAGAMAKHREEEGICRYLGDREGLAASLGNQALLLMAAGDLDAALALGHEQERLCRELGHVMGLQSALGNQALVHLRRGDLDRAVALATEQERLCRDMGYPTGLQAALDTLGQIHAAAGHRDQAWACYQEAERICRSAQLLEGLQESLGHQAELALTTGHPDAALALAEEQERLCRDRGLQEGVCRALLVQGQAVLALRGAFEARFLLEEAAAVAADHGLVTLQPRVADALASCEG